VLVGDDETAFAYQRGQSGRIGCEAHGGNDRILLTNKTSDERLGLKMKVGGPPLGTGAKRANSVSLDSFLDRIRTASLGLSEAEIVVRRDVHRAGTGPGEMERFVVVLGVAIEENDRSTGDLGDRARETVFDS